MPDGNICYGIIADHWFDCGQYILGEISAEEAWQEIFNEITVVDWASIQAKKADMFCWLEVILSGCRDEEDRPIKQPPPQLVATDQLSEAQVNAAAAVIQIAPRTQLHKQEANKCRDCRKNRSGIVSAFLKKNGYKTLEDAFVGKK